MQDLMALQQQMSEDLALLRQDITAQRTELNQLLDQVKAFEAKIEPMQDTRPPTGKCDTNVTRCHSAQEAVGDETSEAGTSSDR